MKLKIYTVYDSKVESFMNPFYAQATGAALRSWSESVNDPQTPFNRHPADFTLFEIGEYDSLTAQITMLPAMINLGTALQYKNSSAEPMPLFNSKQLNAVPNQGATQ